MKAKRQFSTARKVALQAQACALQGTTSMLDSSWSKISAMPKGEYKQTLRAQTELGEAVRAPGAARGRRILQAIE